MRALKIHLSVPGTLSKEQARAGGAADRLTAVQESCLGGRQSLGGRLQRKRLEYLLHLVGIEKATRSQPFQYDRQIAFGKGKAALAAAQFSM